MQFVVITDAAHDSDEMIYAGFLRLQNLIIFICRSTFSITGTRHYYLF